MNRIPSVILLILISIYLTACNSPDEPAVAEIATAVPATQTSVPTMTAQPTKTATPIPPPATPSPEPSVTNTPEPGTTPTETAVPTNTPEPTAVPPTGEINGLLRPDFIVVPENVINKMRDTFTQGQTLGRNPNNFSKLGDSVIANGDFLTRFDTPGQYTLGPDYEQFQRVIDHYAGSYERFGVGMKVGLRAWGVFNPTWADSNWCEPNEVMIDCEFRLNNPSIVLIHLGTNDTGETFEEYLRLTVETSLQNGVIPVLLTKADRFEGEDNRNNIAIRQIAADFEVPLLDYDILAETLPDRGLLEDGVHLNGPNMHDYTQDIVFEKGHTVHNLAVLMMLETLLDQIVIPQTTS